MAGRSHHLVIQHIERIPRRILEEQPEVVREYVKGKRGVYSLYKRAKLYYVGLASDLRSRLKGHLRDRHAGAWDTFSLYLTEIDTHLRELEALVLRITMPRGNRAKTKFARSQDLRRYFRRIIAEAQRRELDSLFNPDRDSRSPRGRRDRVGRAPSLARYVTDRRLVLRWRYKGKVYRAIVRRKDGRIKFKKKLFNSPSHAATAVSHRPMNGWFCWRYEVSPGVWVRIDRLRRKR